VPPSVEPLPLRLGYKASAEQFTPSDLIEFGVLAERAGLDSVFISDHLQPWRHTGGHAPAAIPWLGALGARTERIVLGTSVLTPTMRYHPAVIAQAFGTLGALYPGRVVLGVGTGESLNEVALGIAWPDQKERFARLKEAVLLIERLWSEDRVTHEGAYYRTENVTLYDRPDRPVPIYIGGAGPAATRLAGRIGQGFITTSGKPDELYRDVLMPAFAEGLGKREAPSPVDTMLEVKLAFDSDRERARSDTRFWGALALTPEEKTGIEDPAEMERRADALPIDRVARRWIVTDDPTEVVDAVRPYVDLGFRHLVFHAPGDDQRRFLELFGEHVAPRLRSAFG
jgi:coenzyme F420-dependent glucose-6-phosphate dehydrogenase